MERGQGGVGEGQVCLTHVEDTHGCAAAFLALRVAALVSGASSLPDPSPTHLKQDRLF